MGNDNSLLIVVLAVIAYVVMTGKGVVGAVSSAVTSACPRGKRYSRGFFGDCDPNYVFGGWADQYCDCLTQTPTSVPDAAHTPQTPTPFTSVPAEQRAASEKCKIFDDGVWWKREYNPIDGTVTEARAQLHDYFLPRCV